MPFTVSVAVVVVPDPASVAVPSAVGPTVNVTLPVGAVLPVPAFTDTVRTLLALCAIVVGAAAKVVVVAVGGGVTVTLVAVDADPVKPDTPP